MFDVVPYEREYTEAGLWAKLGAAAGSASRELIEKTLWLYFAAQRSETPAWAKATVYGALGYFILPADLVPDPVPLGGFFDDMAILAFAVATIASYIDADVKRRTASVMQRIFDISHNLR